MKRVDLWKLSMLNVFSSPVRSLLTVLGMAIGIGAILAVMTLGDAGRMQVRSEMGRLGIDKVWLTSGTETLRLGDEALLGQEMRTDAAGAVYLPAALKCGAQQVQAMLVGCTQTYPQMLGADLLEGRMLCPLEWEEDSRSALAGIHLARKLHLQPGSVVHVQGIPFVICGILAETEIFTRTDLSEALLVPCSALKNHLGDALHEIVLDVGDDQTPAEAAAQAEQWFLTQLGRSAQTVTMQVQLEAADSVILIFVEVLRWVALICVLVGGVGVMNILLIGVRERRREIGVMKSLGTSHRQICALFLMEALCYALIGGILGILTGLGLVAAAGGSIGLKPVVKGTDCACVFLAALGIGLFFGVFPAARAARMNCVDALRNE